MKPKIEPRIIILEAIKNYLDEKKFAELTYDLYYNYKKRDSDFIKTIESYFDFSLFIKSPKNFKDVWIYNYLMYETKRPKESNPLSIGDKINFIGAMPKKGLIVKYKKFLESIPNRQPLKIIITHSSK